MTRQVIFAVLTTLIATGPASAQVRVLEAGSAGEGDGTLTLAVDGEAFTTYRSGPSQAKPFFAPLLAPGGIAVTRGLDAAELVGDRPNGRGSAHPHHKGLWVAIQKVTVGGKKLDHWHERHAIATRTQVMTQLTDTVRLDVVNDWLDGEGQPVLAEATRWTISPDRLVAADMVFLPSGDKPVTFEDTKEGFFAVRIANELRAMANATTVISNADGLVGADACWGRRSDWVDYSGEVDGRRVGVTIFDHPENRYRARYHVRAYGLFAANPFGESAYTDGRQPPRPLTLVPGSDGQSLRLRYAAWIHGDVTTADIADRYRVYVEASRSDAVVGE
ncbi:MAG: PmoA family protein [Planctomycetota bacterium]